MGRSIVWEPPSMEWSSDEDRDSPGASEPEGISSVPSFSDWHPGYAPPAQDYAAEWRVHRAMLYDFLY